MADEKIYKRAEDQPFPVVNESEPFMRTFSSQEEADNFRLKKSLERTDMERF